MYTSRNENKLIFPDIVDLMTQYVALQPDIDETMVKAACLMAQNIDIKRVLGKDNLERLIEQEGVEFSNEDKELIILIEAPLCYYTYSRLLLSFQGNFTDSGFTTDQLATSLNEAKRVSKEMKSVADTYMEEVIEYLKVEDINTVADSTKLSSEIRVFGGKEYRSSN